MLDQRRAAVHRLGGPELASVVAHLSTPRAAAVLDAVHDDADVTVISRRDGADAVVMSFDYYQSIMETMHLLASPANAAHLAKSIAQHKAGKAVRRPLSHT